MFEMMSILNHPSMMHAAVVHLPIALISFGVPMLLLSALFHKNNSLRFATFLLFATAAATAYIAVESGERANNVVPVEIPAEVSDLRDKHMELGVEVLYASAATAALVLLSLVRQKDARIGFMLLSLIGAIGSALLVAYTGHIGGELVYIHGIGTPHMKSYTAPPAQPAAADAAPAPAPAPAPPKELVAILPIDLEAAKLVSYTRDIAPILEESCLDCHDGEDADGEFAVNTVAQMAKGGVKGGVGIVPGNPDASSLVQYIRGEKLPRMPKKEPALSVETLHTIRQWIAAGAIDDSAPAPDVTPAPALDLSPVPAEAAMTEAAPGTPNTAEITVAPAQ